MSDYDPITSRCWTREMAASSVKETYDTTFPLFRLSKTKPIMPGYNIWDAWFVLNEEDGQIADIYGSHMLVALGSKVGTNKAQMMYFLSTDGEHYQACGRLNHYGNPYIDGNNKDVLADGEEWSGCSIYREGRYVQTFYTLANGVNLHGVWEKRQQFATVTHSLKFKNSAGVWDSTNHEGFNSADFPRGYKFRLETECHNIIAEPQPGTYYQTTEDASKFEAEHPTQHDWAHGNDQANNFCFRDPKFIKVKGTKDEAYLIFEANTADTYSFPDKNKPGLEGVYDKRFIGSDEFIKKDVITPDAEKANACIGLLRLSSPEPTSTFQGAKNKYSSPNITFLPPVFYANYVTDEIERINLVEYDDHYYLFFATHSNKMAFTGEDMVNRDMMIGFRSVKPISGTNLIQALSTEGAWTPLNGNGVVIQQKSPGARFAGQDEYPHYVYSWMVLPDLTVLSYASHSSDVNGNVQPVKTMGPSIQLSIEGLTTQIKHTPIYNFKPMQ